MRSTLKLLNRTILNTCKPYRSVTVSTALRECNYCCVLCKSDDLNKSCDLNHQPTNEFNQPSKFKLGHCAAPLRMLVRSYPPPSGQNAAAWHSIKGSESAGGAGKAAFALTAGVLSSICVLVFHWCPTLKVIDLVSPVLLLSIS